MKNLNWLAVALILLLRYFSAPTFRAAVKSARSTMLGRFWLRKGERAENGGVTGGPGKQSSGSSLMLILILHLWIWWARGNFRRPLPEREEESKLAGCFISSCTWRLRRGCITRCSKRMIRRLAKP